MKIGTVEPKYTDLHPMQGVIEDEALAFIYGAIAKYGIQKEIRYDEEFIKSLKDYISRQVEYIGK